MGNKNKQNQKATHKHAEKPSDSNDSSISNLEDCEMGDSIDLAQELITCIRREKANFKASRSKVELLKTQLQQSQEEVQISQAISKSLEQQVKQLKDDVKAKVETTEQLEKEMVKFRSDNRTAQRLQQELTKECLEHENQFKSLTNQIQQQGTIIAELERYQTQQSAALAKVETDSGTPQDTNPILNALADEFKSGCDACQLLSAKIIKLEQEVTTKSRMIYRPGHGIFAGFHRNDTDDGEGTIELDLTPMQMERVKIWKKGLSNLLNIRVEDMERDQDQQEFGAALKTWKSNYTYHDNLDMAQALFNDNQNLYRSLSIYKEKVDELVAELSRQKIKAMEDKEKLLASHATAIAGLAAQAEIKLVEEEGKHEKLKAVGETEFDSLKEAHKSEINILKANFEAQITQIESKNKPTRDIGEKILARERELGKPWGERNEEIIDLGNLAAHGGNCLAASQQIASSPKDEDREWFESSYGISVETFIKCQRSPTMRKIFDMRYEMKKFKSISFADSTFEKNFSWFKSHLIGVEHHLKNTSNGERTESSGTVIDEDDYSDLDSMFKTMCEEYHRTSEEEKQRRRIETKERKKFKLPQTGSSELS